MKTPTPAPAAPIDELLTPIAEVASASALEVALTDVVETVASTLEVALTDAVETVAPLTVNMDDLELHEEPVHVGSPSDWELVSGPDNTIIATNRHTNAVYEGEMAGFNALLRG